LTYTTFGERGESSRGTVVREQGGVKNRRVHGSSIIHQSLRRVSRENTMVQINNAGVFLRGRSKRVPDL